MASESRQRSSTRAATSDGRAGLASRRRPKDRKLQILAAAARAFRDLGYDHVAMADVADAVGISPSALYRHFTGKRELLLAAMTDALDEFERPARTATDPDTLRDGLVGVALGRREFGLMWERESGHLADTDRDRLRLRLRAIAERVAALFLAGPRMSAPEADLRAWAVLSVLDSPSHHRLDLDAVVYRRVLERAIAAVCQVDLPENPPADHRVTPLTSTGLRPSSRREALLASAMRLFSERGYSSVGMADIGADAGVTGASVYNHFASKADLLVAALTRGTEVLWLGLHHALRRAATPAEALELVVADYTGFAINNPDVIDILVSELINLPAEHRDTFRRAQQDYLTEWVALLQAARPQFDDPTARATVHAALGVANSLSRIYHLRQRRSLVTDMTTLALAVVHAPMEL